MKQNNRGMTLVEVVVAFAILGFLSAAIFSMIVTGTKTYTRLTGAINLQYDTQLASAKIEKQLLNCNEGIDWNDNQLVMVEDGTVHVYRLKDETLYYGTGVLNNNRATSLNMYKLAENVNVMKITDYEYERVPEGFYHYSDYIKCLHFQMEMENNDKVATVDKTISLRNQPKRRTFTLNLTYINN